MLILKSTHEKLVAHAREQERSKRDDIVTSVDRALNAERSITASLRAEIEVMKPDFELGRHTRSIRKAQDERRKAERAAKRAGI